MNMKILRVLFFLLWALALSSCKPDAGTNKPLSSFAFNKNGIVSPATTTSVAPVVPVGPTLVLFSTLTPTPYAGVSANPTVLVSNVNQGDIVNVYSDSNCTILKGSAISPATSVSITLSSLLVGDYLFYAQTTNFQGQLSPCSNVPVAFSFTGVNPVIATGMSVQSPAPLTVLGTTFYSSATPTITLTGVQTGDYVYLYTDSSCTNVVGSKLVSTTAQPFTITTSPLTVGNLVLYTNSKNKYGISTPCSTIVHLAYTYNYLIDVTWTYDFVPTSTGKWDYENKSSKPIRNAFVEMRRTQDSSLLYTFTTDANGNFKYAMNRNDNIYFILKAKTASPSITIQDNTNLKTMYAVTTNSIAINNNFTNIYNMTSGWSGTNAAGGYVSTRLAAPFAIMDSLYQASQKILSANNAIVFPDLRVNWSINNINLDGDKTQGNILSTHYDSVEKEIYVLGLADVHADEYNRHKLVKTWGNYFIANFSRSDSMGGLSNFGERKDMSLAFNEGWCTALAAMVFDVSPTDKDPVYVDVYGPRQQLTLEKFNIETPIDIANFPAYITNPGWFSAASIAKIIYDLYDSTNVGEPWDQVNLGIAPIYNVMVGAFKTSSAPTSIFSFIYYLKLNNPGIAAAIDAVVAQEGISSVQDQYGTGETHNAGIHYNLPITNILQVGTVATPGNSITVNLWGYSNDSDGVVNSTYNNRYYRFIATSHITQINFIANNSFIIQVFNKGVLATKVPTGVINEVLVPANWSYAQSSTTPLNGVLPNITTVPGQEYFIHVTADVPNLFNPTALNNFPLTLFAIGL